MAEDVDQVIADYLRRTDRGESVERDRFLRAHRSIAAPLTEFFENLDYVGRHVVPVDFHSDSTSAITVTSTGKLPRREFVRLESQHFRLGGGGRTLPFGDYDLIRELGRGGMGIVFMARQRSLDRIVCIKMMLMPELAEVSEFRRFRGEAMAIARLNHPGIVAIHEVGQHAGTPFYAMEYVDGAPVSKGIAEGSFCWQESAEIVIQIAEAIEVAHRQGIVHRDLKPSNVLVDAHGQIHITDFGLAKHIGAGEDLTVTGQVLGTPAYMSPEQADARHGEVGPSTDIYALGAILYALLTGRPPHRAQGPLETVRQVILEPPVRPSLLNESVPKNLETICLKCLEKAPADRYGSAMAVADDLRRFVAGEPIEARRLGRFSQSVRWIRRHPSVSLLTGGLLLAFVFWVVGLFIYNAELSRLNAAMQRSIRIKNDALQQSRVSELAARNLLYISDMQLIETLAVEGDHRSSVELLRRNIPPAGGSDPRGLEWFVLKQRRWRSGNTILAMKSPAYAVVYHPQQKLAASAGADAVIRCYSMADQQLLASIETEQIEVNSLAVSPDGDRIASSGDDGTVKIWNLHGNKLALSIEAHEGPAFRLRYVRDGRVLASCGRDGSLRLWDANNGRLLTDCRWQEEPIDDFVVTPDGRYAWAVSADRFAVRIDLDSGEALPQRIMHGKRPTCIALAPDASLLVTGEIGRHVTVCNCETLAVERIETSHSIQSVAVSPDGRFLVAGDRNGSVRAWLVRASPEAACGYEFEPLDGWCAHDGRVYGLAFCHDARQLISVGSDGKVLTWTMDKLVKPSEYESLMAPNSGSENSFAFFPDSSLLVSANPRSGLDFWDCASGGAQPELTLPMPQAQCVGCSASGRYIAGGSGDGKVMVWHMPTQQLMLQVKLQEGVSQLTFSPDDQLLAVVTWQYDSAFRQTQIFQLDNGQPLFPGPQRNWRHVGFSRDGQRLYVALDEEDHVIEWDLVARRVLSSFNQHDTTIIGMKISPDGQFVVTASSDRRMLVHRNNQADDDAVIGTGLQGDLSAFAMGPLNKSVIVTDSLGVVRVCNLKAARRVIDLLRVFQPQIPEGLAMSSNGRFLAMRCEQLFRIYDLLPEGPPW